MHFACVHYTQSQDDLFTLLAAIAVKTNTKIDQMRQNSGRKNWTRIEATL